MVINPIVGVYIPIIRIPVKGGMTIPNIATFDHGTYSLNLLFPSFEHPWCLLRLKGLKKRLGGVFDNSDVWVTQVNLRFPVKLQSNTHLSEGRRPIDFCGFVGIIGV